MHSEINARFMLKGDFDPDEVSNRIGLEPTETWRRGDPVPHAPLLRRHSDLWLITSSKAPHASLREQVDDLLSVLVPHSDRIAREASNEKATLFISVYTYGGDRPALGLDRQAVEWLGSVHADVDIDLYVLPDEAPSNAVSAD